MNVNKLLYIVIELLYFRVWTALTSIFIAIFIFRT
jgi:hypothetical protein